MKEFKGKTAVKALIFLLLFVLLFQGANALLLPKNYALTSDWPASSNTEGVYRLEKNSLDLLILGSSKAYTAFVPQIIYDEYGMRAYNLGTDLQSPHMSYYWLREALKRQSPKIVVLETSMFFPVITDQPLNTSEAMMRKAMDPMRWSFNKLHALWEIYRLDKTQNWKSYVFPNLRFHERWKEWNEDDFTLSELRVHNELLGWSPLMEKSGIDDFRPIHVEPLAASANFAPYMEMYLDRITALCRERSITLVLVTTPDTGASAATHRSMENYAKSNSLHFLDLNEQECYEAMGYDFAEDNADFEHPNVSGAQKLSRRLGEYLYSEYPVQGGQGSAWENGRTYYSHILDEWSLRGETVPEHYCEALEELACTVFLAMDKNWADTVTPSVQAFLTRLGAEPEKAFWAVLENGVPVSAGTEKEAFGSFRSGRSRYEISTTQPCSIALDGREQAKEGKGISIVIYDSLRRRLIDSVCLQNGVIR